MLKDKIFSTPKAQANFVFDNEVAEVFEDMIQRSVPGYSMMLDLIGLIAHRYVKPGTNIYDLGCSLGAATQSILNNIKQDNCSIIAVDNSMDMIERCRRNIKADDSFVSVNIIHDDILDIKYLNASLIVMNLTLQFVEISQRDKLLKQLYDCLVPGGVLILSEKIKAESEEENNLLIELYHDFKRRQGYTDLEISQKRDALENVLLPETREVHEQRLQDAGFPSVIPWFQSFNFVSLIAIK